MEPSPLGREGRVREPDGKPNLFRGPTYLGSRKRKRIDIQPGMTTTAEIKTGGQTVTRYLTNPTTITLGESLLERGWLIRAGWLALAQSSHGQASTSNVLLPQLSCPRHTLDYLIHSLTP